MAFEKGSSGFPLMIIPIVAIMAVVFIINILVRRRSCDNLEMSSTREASHQEFPNPHQVNPKASGTIALDEVIPKE
ncbi:unnamed protein product [Orchesella dallaii]|uniref:Uncharacterized protein n=1 Tax=Orchesella dallaii TaxID=48710 RepID=A0ABP1QE94_9HEXA